MKGTTRPEDTVGVVMEGFVMERGLTKREYIATHIMAAMTGSIVVREDADGHAKLALKYTDALIKALNKPTNDSG